MLIWLVIVGSVVLLAGPWLLVRSRSGPEGAPATPVVVVLLGAALMVVGFTPSVLPGIDDKPESASATAATAPAVVTFEQSQQGATRVVTRG